MKARLNLATKPLQAQRKFLAGSSVLGIAAAVVFLGLGWHVYQAREANAEMRTRYESIQTQVAELDAQRATLERFFNQSENHNLSDRAAFINGLIDARSFNWTRMFMDLEKIVPGGARVVSVEPKQEKGVIQLKFTIGATSDEAELKFIKALEESGSFTHVNLVTVHTSGTNSNTDPIVFELTAEYART